MATDVSVAISLCVLDVCLGNKYDDHSAIQCLRCFGSSGTCWDMIATEDTSARASPRFLRIFDDFM